MPHQSPIEEAAAAESSLQWLGWQMKDVLRDLKEVKDKIDNLGSARVAAMETKIALLEQQLVNMKVSLDTKTGDNRWWIGLAAGLVAMVISIIGAASKAVR